MRSYLIEELAPGQLERICRAFAAHDMTGPIDGIYYLPVPDELRTKLQSEHADSCGPHVFVLEAVNESTLKLELLVRARGRLRCDCVAYATPEQRAYAIDWLDHFIRQLDIAV